ncbi:hypothetical protein L218DRAFT_958517 [Marasmius fiardii PR-910]|nr:hypothetical protein L218DRAFT_958517 [Marasmius fiardii PR-910]
MAVIKDHSYHILDPQIICANVVFEGEVTLKAPCFPLPNPTILPDRIFASFLPILLIRHPCRTVCSLKRALHPLGRPFPDETTTIQTSFKWQRMVYECYKVWFATPQGIEAAGGPLTAEQLPIVIDGDRLANDAEEQMEKLCRILKLDAAEIKYTWEARPPQNMGESIFLETLNNSTGVVKGKVGDSFLAQPPSNCSTQDGSDKIPILEEEVKKWEEEWDEKTALIMKGLVENAIGDYEFFSECSI